MTITDRRGVIVDATDPPVEANPNPGIAIKAPCKIATTANITLSGLQTIEGVTLVADERVLVKNQTDQRDNGLYNASTGNWQRTIDGNSNDKWVAGTQLLITAGTVNGGKSYRLTALDPIEVGVTNLTFDTPADQSAVPTTRAINTVAPLAGGGTLASDLTLTTSLAASSLAGNSSGVTGTIAAIALGATLAFSGSTLQTTAGTGDISWSANSFVTAIGANKVTDAMIRQSAGLSIIGRAANTTGNVADITAASDFQVMRRSGSTIAFGSVNLASTNAVTGQLVAGSMPALTGDVTTAGGALATTIAANVVTYAKFQQVAASSLVGNATGSLANATGITLGATLAFSGSALQTAALSGDISTSANSFVTTIGSNKVTLGMMAQVATATFLGRVTAGTGNVEAMTVAQAAGLFTKPTQQIFTSSSGTYTLPANCRYIRVRCAGGGGGGSGGNGGGNGGNGGNTTFGSSFLTANGGSGSTSTAGGNGGGASGGTINITGGAGNGSIQLATATPPGASGGASILGPAGGGGSNNGIGGSGAGYGGGGGGAGAVNGVSFPGGGGGGGGYVEHVITSPSGTYAYAVGAAGTAGTAAAGGGAGGAGAPGVVIVDEYYV